MRVVVTGGLGFIGSAFVRLYHNKYNIAIVDKHTYAADPMRVCGCRYHLVKDDISTCSFALLRPDVIINFAANTHVDNSIKDDNPFLRSNIDGVVNILRYAKESGCSVIQVSTDEVYGSRIIGSFKEADRFNTGNSYSASKASAEHFCTSYHNTFGVDVKVTRGANTLGPFQFPEKLIPLALRKLRNKEKIPVYGEGLQVRDWLYVDDHARAIEAVMLHGKAGEAYNINGFQELCNIDLVTKLIDVCIKQGWDFDPDNSIEFVPDRLGHDYRYSMCGDKIRELGWKPTVDLDEGLIRTVNAFR